MSSFSPSLEQYKQPIIWFDGLEANAELNENVEYDRVADRPAWYNRVPIAYIQRIVVKSIINIPEKSSSESHNQLHLIDAFRTPLAQLFELNEFVKNFQTEKSSLQGDLCVHVGALTKNERFLQKNNINELNKHHLPEFNCLYLSPANFWLNNMELFGKDEDLMKTINELSPLYFKASLNSKQSQPPQSKQNLSDLFASLWNHLYASSTTASSPNGDSDNERRQSRQETKLRDLLFGVAWPSVFKALDDDQLLIKELNKTSKWVISITNILSKFLYRDTNS